MAIRGIQGGGPDVIMSVELDLYEAAICQSLLMRATGGHNQDGLPIRRKIDDEFQALFNALG